jgi:hypothetical protein
MAELASKENIATLASWDGEGEGGKPRPPKHLP